MGCLRHHHAEGEEEPLLGKHQQKNPENISKEFILLSVQCHQSHDKTAPHPECVETCDSYLRFESWTATKVTLSHFSSLSIVTEKWSLREWRSSSKLTVFSQISNMTSGGGTIADICTELPSTSPTTWTADSTRPTFFWTSSRRSMESSRMDLLWN